jgi:hypothetical protein
VTLFQKVRSESEFILKIVSNSDWEEDIHRSDQELGRRRRIFARTAIHQGEETAYQMLQAPGRNHQSSLVWREKWK